VVYMQGGYPRGVYAGRLPTVEYPGGYPRWYTQEATHVVYREEATHVVYGEEATHVVYGRWYPGNIALPHLGGPLVLPGTDTYYPPWDHPVYA